MIAAILLLALSSQSEQIPDDDFLLQLLPGIIGASIYQQAVNNTLPKELEQIPVISISANEIETFSFQFKATVLPVDAPISNYLWSFGDGLQASGKSPLHHYSETGEYVIGLQASTAAGEKYFSEKTINVRAENKPPVARFTLSTSNGYAPLTVELDAQTSSDEDGTITSYYWTFGDGSTATGSRTTHQYQSQGIYTRYATTLTVTDDRQGQHRFTQYVSVKRADNLPTAHYEMSVDEAVAPHTIKFDASDSTDLDGYIDSFLWDFGDGHASSGRRTRHTYTEAGQYHPLLTVMDNSGDIQTFSRQLDILPQNRDPRAVLSISTGDFSAPATVTFNAGASTDEDGSIVSYHWDFGDGGVAEGIVTTHIYSHPGDYTATLFVTDQQGGVGLARKIQTISGVSEPDSGFKIRSPGGETTENPYLLGGSAEAGSRVKVYLDDAFFRAVEVDDQGGWVLAVPLQDGLNVVKSETTQNEQSVIRMRLLKYLNTQSRDLSGKMISDTRVLTPGVPPLAYVVNDANLSIAETGKLVLQAGTDIQFNGSSWPILRVDGILEVRGEVDRKVHLTSDILDENGDPGKWSGIHVSEKADYVSMKHAVIDQTNWAIVSGQTPVTIENSLIRHGVIELAGTAEQSIIKNSRVEGMNSGLLIFGNSYVSVQGNTFTSDVSPIRVDCYASGCPVIDINNNNLLMSKPLALHDNYVRLRGHQSLDARGNWWGTTDIHQIGDPYLDTRGFLDGPVPAGSRFFGEIFDQQGQALAVEHNLSLQAGELYLAYSDIIVPLGDKLTLEAGAILRLDNRYSKLFDLVVKGELVLEEGARIEAAGFNAVRVEGALFVNGSELRPVVFTSVQDTPGYDDWSGIQIMSSAATVQIDHALIEHANKGVSFIGASGRLSNSEFLNNQYGVWIEGDSTPFISGNTITANETGIFDRVNGVDEALHAQIIRNNLAGNSQYAVYLSQKQAADEIRFLRENWWGSTDVVAISEQIFDGYDASNHPFVDYSDYLDGPIPDGELYQDGVRVVSLINTDTVLIADEHPIVIADVYVARGATLTLAAGTRLIMPGNATSGFNFIVDGALVLEAGATIEFTGANQELQINGAMTARGTVENPIVFSSSGSNQMKGDWHGIHLTPSASHFTLEHAQVRNAKRGVWFEDVSGQVHDSHFDNNEVAVLGSGSASPDLQANTFSSNNFDVRILGVNIDPDNMAPIAAFVSSNAVAEGASIVHFNANASSDDGQIIAYHWETTDGGQAVGKEVDFDFSAQSEQTVKLTIMDEQGATGQSTRTIRLSSVNQMPIANAGIDQSVSEGELVNLDARNSHDDEFIAEYFWEKILGPDISLIDSNTAISSFTMPELDEGQSLLFKLTVRDNNSLYSSDTVEINLLDTRLAPFANAGEDQSVEAGAEVWLDGAHSFDQNGVIQNYLWTQTAGPEVTLSDPDEAVTLFTMPVLVGNESLEFELRVTDDDGLEASDQLMVSRFKEVVLSANVSSGIAPLEVNFQVESRVSIDWVNFSFDDDEVIDVSQRSLERFAFRYEIPGVYEPYVGVRNAQGEWFYDRMTIRVNDPEQEKKAIQTQWNAMTLALLSGNIDAAMDYFSDVRREQFAYMFNALGDDRLLEIFGNFEGIKLNEVSGGYAEIAVLKRQEGQLYAYSVGMLKDENGVWKILKM